MQLVGGAVALALVLLLYPTTTASGAAQEATHG
jgi:hypothetical protein